MTNLVFCYGTLMFPGVMKRAAGKYFKFAPAVTYNYGRYKVIGASFPGIKEEVGTVVDGVVYFNVDDEALKYLDRYEGEGSLYSRKLLKVFLTNNDYTKTINSIEAWAYIFNDVSRLSKEAWDRDYYKLRSNHVK